MTLLIADWPKEELLLDGKILALIVAEWTVVGSLRTHLVSVLSVNDLIALFS